MKKRIITFLLAAIMLMSAATLSAAAEDTITEGKDYIYINGEKLTFDMPRVVQNERTLVPFRAIFEAFGADVDWNEQSGAVTGMLADDSVTLTIGSDIAVCNGEAVALDAVSIIYNGKMLVPLRFAAESLGMSVYYEPNSTDIYITSQKQLELTAYIHKNVLGELPDWPIFGREGGAAAMTNIDLAGMADSENFQFISEFEKMLEMSPLPDIIQGYRFIINNPDIVNNKMTPLNDLITDEYTPNIKRFFQKYPEAWAESVALDGNLYHIPSVRSTYSPHGFFIRKDWLDKLGLAVPTTVDEYYTVLKAFREQDPNGNGIKDEVPYFDTYGSLNALIQLFGAHTGWYVADDGAPYYGKITEEYKNAIKNLARWHAEGLIDPDLFQNRDIALGIMLDADIGGATYEWFSKAYEFDRLPSNTDGVGFIAIAPPADIYGNVKNIIEAELLDREGWGISIDNCHLPETLRYFDFWFSEPGQRLYSYGIEGVDYTIIDGVPTFTDAALNDPYGKTTRLRFKGQVDIGAQISLESDIAYMNQIGRDGAMMYDSNGYALPPFPRLNYTDEEMIVYDKYFDITLYIRDMEKKWLAGVCDVDETWDEYLRTIDEMGYHEVLLMQKTAYDRYLKDLDAAKELFGN